MISTRLGRRARAAALRGAAALAGSAALVAVGVLVSGVAAAVAASTLALGFVGTRLLGFRLTRAEAIVDLEVLVNAARTDPMTGLRNRRAFGEDLTRELERRNRFGSPFSLLMIDLDGLKEVNDSRGHQAGDEVISAAARCLRATVRGSDCAYRIGGDEFAVLLPGERAWGALTFAQRLHRHAGNGLVPVRLTVGIAESRTTESPDAVVHQADLALYDAKRSHLSTAVFNAGLELSSPFGRPGSSGDAEEALATLLARVVDAKDEGARRHSETVAELCALVGAELGLESARVQRLRIAGLLHDVGVVAVADEILQKPDVLSPAEQRTMASHPAVGHDIVAAVDLTEEAQWILHHHERWDGSGYPGGLRGDEIPLESRIIHVADAFEAMTADRPHRAPRPPEEAIAELVTHAGTQFDPRVVQALRAVVDDVPDGGASAAVSA